MAEEETREATGVSQLGPRTPQQELRTALTSGVHLADGAPGPASSVATSLPSGTSGKYILRFVVKIKS